uniref:Uncharacterized protein n=1 Tax=Daphnia galeata TaxID=27404 RepID=A0A8J2RVD6_9CRUS|nr:unnamed protein product [Daphnia galeata]
MIILNRTNFKRGVSLWVDRFKFKIISIVACYFLSLHIPCKSS